MCYNNIFLSFKNNDCHYHETYDNNPEKNGSNKILDYLTVPGLFLNDAEILCFKKELIYLSKLCLKDHMDRSNPEKKILYNEQELLDVVQLVSVYKSFDNALWTVLDHKFDQGAYRLKIEGIQHEPVYCIGTSKQTFADIVHLLNQEYSEIIKNGRFIYYDMEISQYNQLRNIDGINCYSVNKILFIKNDSGSCNKMLE